MISPADTNVLAVLGVFPSGSLDEAVLVSSWADFEARFGSAPSLAAYAVYQFFLGGGSGAWIVRAESAADPQALGAIASQPFNLMCIPDLALLPNEDQQAGIAAAHAFCKARNAFLLVDPPSAGSPDDVLAWARATGVLSLANVSGAVYYPWVEIADPWNGSVQLVPPSGTVAAVYAATDAARGVWKAPAGVGATLVGVSRLAYLLRDEENGKLNVEGINGLRTFPVYGSVVWGARTLAGTDAAASDFKYVPVRRLANFIVRSVLGSLGWAASEPNGPPLWSTISLEVSQFMAGLFGSGALAGTSPSQAYFVVCDGSTTTEIDKLAGVVNVQIGFAPMRPAEFVVLDIKVDAGPPAGG